MVLFFHLQRVNAVIYYYSVYAVIVYNSKTDATDRDIERERQ